jgi:hypothetical protein
MRACAPFINKSMPAVPTIPTAARSARRLGHTGDRFTSTFGKKAREFALGVFPAAQRARDGHIRLAHRPNGLKHLLTFLTDILINWHPYLTEFLELESLPLNFNPIYFRLKSAGISPQALVSHFKTGLMLL